MLFRSQATSALYKPQKDDRPEHIKEQNAIRAEACRRYYADAYYSGTVPRSKCSAGERVSGGIEDQSEEAIARHIAVKTKRANAIRALGELVAIAEWVCVDDYSPAAFASRRGEHPMAGIALFRVAAAQLAKHYGLMK